MTFEELHTKIKDLAAKTGPLGNTLKIDLGDDKIYLDGTGAENTVSAEDKAADCVLITTSDNLSKLLQGDLNPMMAVMTGKLKIKGDMGVAMKVQSLFG
ncbi:MAG: SCP2 sterol-binding domain-containing protein [Lewinella sp.]|nr:SCP2 sterol-binding domain-containing protein [Lewinella sp.]